MLAIGGEAFTFIVVTKVSFPGNESRTPLGFDVHDLMVYMPLVKL